MHMARSLDDLEDEQMRNAMENSENDMGGVDKKAMVSKAIIHLKTENIVAEPSKVTVNAIGRSFNREAGGRQTRKQRGSCVTFTEVWI